jgi:ADP-heptose:LPS heptosyltransferase/glycosyltransferase involved in cell wall biosynthesis
MNILIIKTGALGDVLRTSFLSQGLREKYQKNNPKVYFLTDKNAAPLIENNPHIDLILPKERKEELNKLDFSLIINLEEDLELGKFANSFNTEVRGFLYKDGKIMPSESAKEWFNMSKIGKAPENDILKKKNKKTHRQIISEIAGIPDYEKYEPTIRLTDPQKNLASDFLKKHHLLRKDLIVGINTGSSGRWPKQLSIKKTVSLIDSLSRKLKAKILLFGGPEEIERNKEIMKLVKVPVIDTGCNNSLADFIGLISACNLFITTDSLGLHISLAIKRKTIVLVGPTSAAELELYGLGEKVVSKSKCACCYKSNCKSMDMINVKDISSAVEKVISQKITLVITAFKEPLVSKAIESALNQKTEYDYDIIVSAPDKETMSIAEKYAEKNKKIRIVKDPGKGKSFALNNIFSKVKSDILILTDGDVYISENSVEEIINLFLYPEVGCVSGRPVPQESKETKYGYWSNFLFNAAHRIRKKAFESDSFIECSGYLFAFRSNGIREIPLDVAEDTIIPNIMWRRGYRIGYAEKAEVYVKNPNNFKDWVKQKTRTHKAHEKIDLYVNVISTPKVKTFKTESKGVFMLLKYPKNSKEAVWTVELIYARLYTWVKYYLETKLFNRKYTDAWERVESTKN